MSTTGLPPLVSQTTVMDRLSITLEPTFVGHNLVRALIIESWAIDNASGPVRLLSSKNGLTVEFDDPADLSLFVLDPPISIDK